MIDVRPLMQESGEGSDGAAERGDEVREEPSGEAAQEEEAAVRGVRDPAEPSRDERARHELTHVPFRPWCRHCVSGKAADNPHRRRQEQREEPEVVKASIDYGFIKLDGEETNRVILVFKASPSGMVSARCVTAKGREDPSAAPWVVEQLRRLGADKRVLQADGEPATRALVKDVIEEACASSALGVAGAFPCARPPGQRHGRARGP